MHISPDISIICKKGRLTETQVTLVSRSAESLNNARYEQGAFDPAERLCSLLWTRQSPPAVVLPGVTSQLHLGLGQHARHASPGEQGELQLVTP